jgi:hypothetical protein
LPLSSPLRTGLQRVLSERISTRIRTDPELEKALKLAYDIKEAAPDQETILTVHGLKRLTRNATEPMALSGQLQDASSSPCSRPHPLPAQHPVTT